MKKIVLLLIILHTVSCVSMKKFSSSQTLLTNLRKDSVVKAKLIGEQNDRIDELLRRNISLGRDTLRLYSDYATLLENSSRTEEENRQEIVRLNSLLYGTNRRSNASGSNNRVTKVSASLTKSIAAFGEEVRQVLRNEPKNLYTITNKNWELTIRLRDSLLYVPVMDNDRV
ncbi:MAG: hypothetical protein RR550_04095, partial [Rikenellaceae bacterium]